MVNFITSFLFPVLAGLTLAVIVSRALRIWQAKDRAAHTLAFCAFYVGSCIVFLTYSLDGDVIWLGAGYSICAVALLVGAFFEWRDLILWLRQKDEVFQEAELIHTLDEVAADNSLMLEAEVASPTHTLQEVAGDNDLVLEAGVKDESIPPPANEDARR